MREKILENLTMAFRNRFVSKSPLFLSHMVTSLCNARCEFCALWKRSSQYNNDMSLSEIFSMLRKAREAGIVSYTAWGGEPLLRQDLHEILECAKSEGFITQIITNGYLLEERRDELAPNTDFLIVSIDSADSLHNELRGVDGILQKAIDGIKAWKQTETRIVINSVIAKANKDKIGGLVGLSESLEVPISFEPMQVNEENEEYRFSDGELKRIFAKIAKYKKSGSRIVNSLPYLRNFFDGKNYVCHYPKLFVKVEADGEVNSCDDGLDKYWGNINDISFQEIFQSKEYEEFCKRAEKCDICDVSCVIESSLGYSLNPQYIIDKIRNF